MWSAYFEKTNKDQALHYNLELTIRLCKVLYLDTRKSITNIGEQQFYLAPTFEKVVLDELYQNQVKHKGLLQSSGDAYLNLPHVPMIKIREISSDIVKTVPSDHLLWCPIPYEMPCQSLFFSLLRYSQTSKQLNWIVNMDEADGASYEQKLINFTFCHLSNIKGSMDHVADCTTTTFKNQVETK